MREVLTDFGHDVQNLPKYNIESLFYKTGPFSTLTPSSALVTSACRDQLKSICAKQTFPEISRSDRNFSHTM